MTLARQKYKYGLYEKANKCKIILNFHILVFQELPQPE